MPASRMSGPCRFLCSLELAVPAKRTADGGRLRRDVHRKFRLRSMRVHNVPEFFRFRSFPAVRGRLAPPARRTGSSTSELQESLRTIGTVAAAWPRTRLDPGPAGSHERSAVFRRPSTSAAHGLNPTTRPAAPLPGSLSAAYAVRSEPYGPARAPAHGPAAGRRLRLGKRLRLRVAGTPCEQIRNELGADICILFS